MRKLADSNHYTCTHPHYKSIRRAFYTEMHFILHCAYHSIIFNYKSAIHRQFFATSKMSPTKSDTICKPWGIIYFVLRMEQNSNCERSRLEDCEKLRCGAPNTHPCPNATPLSPQRLAYVSLSQAWLPNERDRDADHSAIGFQ